MIELKDDALVFRFPEVHEEALLRVDFQRTLRIPDDGRTYPLPPGLGRFPLRHVDDFAARVPAAWIEHGGVMLPMYQAEALWIHFDRHGALYPFAVRIATGKIDAITGETWSDGISRRPQNYAVVPGQPWLDGYCVEKGVIRQFVAMPLGAGYSAEEQITGKAEHGGLQIRVHPMKAEAWERRKDRMRKQAEDTSSLTLGMPSRACASPAMGLAPGGRMRQQIYRDPFRPDEWDTERSARCFVHIANSLVWEAITGSPPPTPPPTAAQYTRAGLPWFDTYGEGPALPGSGKLAGLLSVLGMGRKKGDVPLPENESAAVERVVRLRAHLAQDEVREGAF